MRQVAPDPPHYAAQDLEALADLSNYQRWILRHFAPHLRGRILEVGAGTGTFAALYLDGAREVVLLEPARNLTARLHDRVGGRDKVEIVPLSLDAARALPDGPLRPGSFDAVVLINVLEHVDDDGGMLAQLRDLLSPNGRLLLFVPALAWIYGSLDAMLDHRRRYARDPLRRLVTGAGFVIEELRYFDALGVVPWWVTGKLLKQRAFNPVAAKIYDETGVRVGSAVERWIAPPIGKNLVCVARV